MFLIKYIWYHYFLRPKGWYRKSKRLFVEYRVHHFMVEVYNTKVKVRLYRRRENRPYYSHDFKVEGFEHELVLAMKMFHDPVTAFWVGRHQAFECFRRNTADIKFYYQTEADWERFKQNLLAKYEREV